MALQKQADQEKRAQVLQSEGAQTSAINVAQGQRQAVIKQDEDEKRSQILRAEARQLVLEAQGGRQAQILEAEGRAQAIARVYGAISVANPTSPFWPFSNWTRRAM